MRIVHEASVIGNGFFEPKSRSGVHRCLCETSRALLHWSDVTQAAVALTGPHAALGLSEVQRHEPHLLPLLLMEPWRWPLGIHGDVVRTHAAWAASLRHDPRYHPRRITTALVTRAWDWLASSIPLDWQDGDLLHSWFFALPPRACSPRRRVITIHDLIPLRHPEWFPSGDMVFFRSILDSITGEDHIICVSEATRRDLVAELPHLRPKTHVIHLGAHPPTPGSATQTVHVPRTPHSATAKPYFLFLGTDEPRKNLRRVIEAYQTGHFPHHDLLVVGATGNAAACQHTADERITFLGRVPDQELATILQGATALVYPSLYEGFGLPVIEAMAAGVPVITSSTSSLPEISGEAALLVDPCSITAISQAMSQIAHDAVLRKELSCKSLEQAAKFTWSRTAALHRDLYRSLL